jgi:hypothetical protein
MNRIIQSIRGIVAAGAMLGASLAFTACGEVSDTLLEATDPDVIEPGTINTPEAAEAVRIGALARFRNITAGGEGTWMLGGLLTDEWKSGDTFLQRNETDQRQVQENNGNVQNMLREIYRARTNAREALNALDEFKPEPASSRAELFFVIGFAEITLGENFCNGAPIGDASTGVPIYGPPLSNQEMFSLALAHMDSAITLASGSDGESARIRTAAQIGKARALIDLGRHDEAASAVAGVASDFRYEVTFSLTSGDNSIWSLSTSARRWVLGDSFDTSGLIENALPFASAADPRIPNEGSPIGTSAAGKSFDGSTNFIRQTLFGRSDPAAVVSGLDAELYRAEALLRANDFAGMMTILNDLRSTPQNLGAFDSPVMAPLPVPASLDDAIDTYFREKAFWTFGRGQRLGDLRRIVRQYNRAQTDVFPNGPFHKGGTYGVDTNFPVTVDELNNPEFTGCINRDA